MFIELLRNVKTTAEYQKLRQRAKEYGVQFLTDHTTYGGIGEHLEKLRYDSLDTMYEVLRCYKELEVTKFKQTSSDNDTELRVRYLPRLVEGGTLLLRPRGIAVDMVDNRVIIVEPVMRYWDRLGYRSINADSTEAECVAKIKKYFCLG